MASDGIRVKAMAIIRRGPEILVSKSDDGEGAYYRPLGGGVEFRESAEDAVVRELREELGVSLADVRLAGVLENLFTLRSEECHEIVFLYEATVDESSLTDDRFLTAQESDGSRLECLWVNPAELSDVPLYPEGLQDLLAGLGQ